MSPSTLGSGIPAARPHRAREPVTTSKRDAVQRVTIQSAVARLGDRDRELIALRYGADLKVREIAELLGARTNTIEVALHRAVERLRQDLATPTTSGEPRTQLL